MQLIIGFAGLTENAGKRVMERETNVYNQKAMLIKYTVTSGVHGVPIKIDL